MPDTVKSGTEQQAPDLEKRVKELEKMLTAARAAAPLTVWPEHGAGPGVDVAADTWSLHDQELSRAGKHPAQRQ